MPFVDGEPIDASKLGALETELNILKANMPKIGSSGTTITVNNPSNPNTTSVTPSGTIVPSTTSSNVWGSVSGQVTLTPGARSTFTINYAAAGLSSTPKAIILTPVGGTGIFSINQALVQSATATSAQCHVYHRSDATAGKVRYYFMVIS
jgi:hypothetical protein